MYSYFLHKREEVSKIGNGYFKKVGLFYKRQGVTYFHRNWVFRVYVFVSFIYTICISILRFTERF